MVTPCSATLTSIIYTFHFTFNDNACIEIQDFMCYVSLEQLRNKVQKLTVTFSAFVVHYLQTIASHQLQRGIIEGIPCLGQNIVNIGCIFTHVNVCLPKLLERWGSLLILLGHFCMYNFHNGTTFPFISTK